MIATAPRTTVLDTFPASSTGLLLPRSQGTVFSKSEMCHQWVLDCSTAGNQVVVPAVCYYEALREWERLGASGKTRRLRQFCFSEPGRFLPRETVHLDEAARMWGQIRNLGLPTAGSDALDVDVLLASQSLALGLPRRL